MRLEVEDKVKVALADALVSKTAAPSLPVSDPLRCPAF